MRIDFDQEIWSPSPNLMPAGRVGCQATQSGFLTSPFNRDVARLYTDLFTGRAGVTGSEDPDHSCRTLNR